MKTVLYLNGRLAVWICFERNTAVNVHVESLYINESAYLPCNWLGKKRQAIHLILDSEQAEIDAHPLQRFGSVLRHRSNTAALRSRLIDQYPEAVVSTPAKATGIDALLVQQPNLRQVTREWLDYVEKSELYFCSVATGVEVLASLFSTIETDYVVVSNVLGYHKHTYCRSGHALFTRSLEQTDSSSLVTGLAETIAHLQTNELIDGAVAIYSIGFSEEQLAPVAKLDEVSETTRYEERSEVQDQSVINHDSDMYQYVATIQLAKHALVHSELRNSCISRHIAPLSIKHSHWIKHRRQRLQTAVLSALVVVSIGFSASKEWRKHQQFKITALASAALSLELESMRQAVQDEHPDGANLSDALQNVAALRSSVGVSPAVLLVFVAEMFTAHRQLVLQELSWVSVEPQMAANDHAPIIQNAASVATRDHLPHKSTAPNSLLVSIMGSSLSLYTLREQQDAVDTIVSQLEQQVSISELLVLDTPLTQAASQDSVRVGAVDSTQFKVQFQVDRPVRDDA